MRWARWQVHAGLTVAPDPFFLSRRRQLVELARDAIPTIYPLREFAATGGLISYAANIRTAFHLLGTYAGKILNGAKPADLPVQQSTTFVSL